MTTAWLIEDTETGQPLEVLFDEGKARTQAGFMPGVRVVPMYRERRDASATRVLQYLATGWVIETHHPLVIRRGSVTKTIHPNGAIS